MEYEFERDSDLRGIWIRGLKQINDYAKKHTVAKEEEIFIPDSLIKALRKLDGK